MKNFAKIAGVFVFALVLGLGMTSCKDDDVCYECTGFDDGTTSLEDLGTICEGDDDGTGNAITEEELEAAVAAYEAFGGSCRKK